MIEPIRGAHEHAQKRDEMQITLSDDEIKAIAKKIFLEMDDGLGQTQDQVDRATLTWLQSIIDDIKEDSAWWAFRCWRTYNFDQHINRLVDREKKVVSFKQLTAQQLMDWRRDYPGNNAEDYIFDIGADGTIIGAALKQSSS